MQGRNDVIDLYEAFDADAPDVRTLKAETQDDFAKAQQMYYEQQFTEAQMQLFKVLSRNSKDKVAWHYLMQATQALEEGVQENWTGVTVMTEK